MKVRGFDLPEDGGEDWKKRKEEQFDQNSKEEVPSISEQKTES